MKEERLPRYCIANSQPPESQQLLQVILKSYLCMMDFCILLATTLELH